MIHLFPTRWERSALRHWYVWVLFPFALLFLLGIAAGRLSNRHRGGPDNVGFIDVALIAKQVVQPTNAISLYLHTRLPTGLRRELAGAQQWGSDISILKDRLAAELKDIIRGECLFDTRRVEDTVRFAGVRLRPRTRELLEQDVIARDNVELNRMLLDDSYPGAIWPWLTLQENLAWHVRQWFLRFWKAHVGGFGFLLATLAFLGCQQRIEQLFDSLVDSDSLRLKADTAAKDSVSEQAVKEALDGIVELGTVHTARSEMALHKERLEVLLRDRKRWLVILPVILLALLYGMSQQPLSQIQILFNVGQSLDTTVWLQTAHAFLFSYFFPLWFGYAFGAGVWAVGAMANSIRHLTEHFVVRIKAGHADGCGGLKALGSFCLLLVTPVLIGIALAAFYAISALSRGVIDDTTMAFIFCDAVALFVFLIPIASVAFFRTLWRVHKVMVEYRHTQQDSHAEQLDCWRAKLNRAVVDGDMDVMQKSTAALSSLREVYPQPREYPVWPFDWTIFLKFATPQIASAVGLVVSFVKKLTGP